MELRVLRYFLAVAQEESISRAAQQLHITQPTLSRQLMDLEEELGVKLFIRGRRSHNITLTEPGRFLRQRALEMIELADKTESAFSANQGVSGIIYIGAGETKAMDYLARSVAKIQQQYPQIMLRIESGDGNYVEDLLDKGIADFGVMIGPVNEHKYDYLPFPDKDVWGVLMHRDMPLSDKKTITRQDLKDQPLILPSQRSSIDMVSDWLGVPISKLHILAMGNLAYNGSILAEQKMGYAFTLGRLIDVAGSRPLRFCPLEPKMEFDVSLVWKKNHVFSRAASLFLEQFRKDTEKI